VRRLADAWGDCEFDWLVAPAFAGVLDYAPVAIRRKVLFRRKELGSMKFFSEFPALIRELRQTGKYDIIIDFQGLFRSAVCGFLAGSREFAGFAAPREAAARLFYRSFYDVPPEIHAVEKNWMLAGKIIGCDDVPVVMPELPVVEKNAREADLLLNEAGITPGGQFFALLPGARWESKRFPEKLFADIANILAPLPCVVLGAPGEEKIAAGVAAGACVKNLAGRTSVGGLMEILRRASAAVCNDSGAMHMASALSVPVAGLYGPTDPVRTGAYGIRNGIFTSAEPCLKCLARECPRRNENDGVVPCHVLNAREIADWLMRQADHSAGA
jgi:heptosyltransferase-1/heptosyltransferase-2